MADSSNIQGPDEPLNSQDKKLYEKEYQEGLDLFKNAMKEYSNADEMHKKAAFDDVMNRALNVLNETARELHRPDLLNQNQVIAQDLKNYENNGDKDSLSQLAQDLKDAKKKL